MFTVSNTSPLLNLAIINHLHLVKKQLQTVLIPNAVFTELRVDENLPGSAALKAALDQGWLIVQPVKNKAIVQLLRRDLDQGESEAIALAMDTNADLILLDEKEGRRIARSLDLTITGILGILLKGWRDGDVTSMPNLIAALRNQAHFHISLNLEREILQKIDKI
jgi:predicted nucleic acid-binding protein